MNSIKPIEYIIVHHTERNNDFPLFVKLRHRLLRGWEDIGYHYLIGNKRPFTANGKIYPGRSENLEGAHTLGYNPNSLAICLIGNLDITIPSKKQLETLVSFLEQKIEQYEIPIRNIKGHNEFQSVEKSCPGKLMNMLYVREVLSGNERFSYQDYVDMVSSSDGLVRNPA